ncbi:unnamed protein product [Rotaria sp. Silwood1]|nr:unnamed protein product [Rotaria sp. Silwood1]
MAASRTTTVAAEDKDNVSSLEETLHFDIRPLDETQFNILHYSFFNRGLNDPILKFPFNYKVVFCFYDQTFAKQHIIDSFRPDIGLSGFQRPRLDMNIVTGISKFVPLTKIQQENSPYIRDDTMFIKIMLDFNDIPNISLPIAMSLNPGLPIHVQHMMIEQEMKQRSEQQSQYSNETKEIKLSCEETAQ